MKSTKAWRLLLVLSLAIANWGMPMAQAAPTCWDCKICSNGISCCPQGTQWDDCTQGSRWNTCFVTQGACSGGAEGEEVEAE